MKWPTGSAPSGDYVYIQKGGSGSGCYSDGIGRRGGRQIINLQDPGCVTKGIIMHENIHAMGFHHEQVRPDRNNYITVYPNEIVDGNANTQYQIYQGSLPSAFPMTFPP
ncbi:astacin [Folsomia candida]|uniref:astacin n=1 Tax=Folsomia candida TaxID=158441 RepID=UPI00160528E3|nr:astacin [Folsomia candida]